MTPSADPDERNECIRFFGIVVSLHAGVNDPGQEVREIPRNDAAGQGIEVRKPSRPDAGQALVYQRLGIDWKRAFPARKFVMKSKLAENEMASN